MVCDMTDLILSYSGTGTEIKTDGRFEQATEKERLVLTGFVSTYISSILGKICSLLKYCQYIQYTNTIYTRARLILGIFQNIIICIYNG